MSVLCLKCGYSVTEPICASCIINEAKIWLREQPIKKQTFLKTLDDLDYFLEQIELLDYAILPSKNPWIPLTMKCIKCDEEIHCMCSHCVMKQASQIVNRNLKRKASMESFQESFNTELYDYGLSHEKNFVLN